VVDQREALDKAIHDLPDRWEWEWFTDVLDVDGGTQPPASEFVDEPRPGYVRLVQIRDFESGSHVTYIPDSRKWRKCRTSDVLIARYGASLGRICTGLEGAYNVALAKVVPTARIHLPFAYYLLRSNYFQGPLLASGGRSAQAGFNKDGLAVIPLPIPPLPEQRAIAHILGALDDKIELNRRMNETLDAMARALFKSWFVDFDPVRAKAEARDPGLPQSLAGLFSNSFDGSELGEIPAGWAAGSVGDFIERRCERAGDREVVVLSAVANGRLAKSDDHFTKRVYSKETAKYLVVEQWDFAYNPSRINIGSIGMLEENIQGGVSPVYVVARPNAAYRWFLEFTIRSTNTKAWINNLASGSVRQSLSYEDFASIPCVIPPDKVAREFDRKWTSVRERMISIKEESKTLATLRDTLLPKLISGELQVKAIGRAMETL